MNLDAIGKWNDPCFFCVSRFFLLLLLTTTGLGNLGPTPGFVGAIGNVVEPVLGMP